MPKDDPKNEAGPQPPQSKDPEVRALSEKAARAARKVQQVNMMIHRAGLGQPLEVQTVNGKKLAIPSRPTGTVPKAAIASRLQMVEHGLQELIDQIDVLTTAKVEMEVRKQAIQAIYDQLDE